MIRKFINKNGHIKEVKIPKQGGVPLTGFYDKGEWWQRYYSPIWVYIICSKWIPAFIRRAILKFAR